jgi:hypothetical protein
MNSEEAFLGFALPAEFRSIEPIVGRSLKYSHTIVLSLVALLAWPWHLALPAFEDTQQRALEFGWARAASKLPRHRVARSFRSTEACAPARWEENSNEDEEGDDGGLPQSAFGFWLMPSACRHNVLCAWLTFAPKALEPLPFSRLCRLRC